MLTTAQRRELGELARSYDLPEAHVLAVVDVESNGQIFATVNGEQRPLILFEPHIFYRRLAGEKRDQAVRFKLASKAWDRKLYPASQAGRWDQLARAMAIDPVAAQESTSWGVGQVMGFHWKALGFDHVDAFVMAARSGLKGQAELMLRYVRANGLEDELRTGQWAPFARGYNGPAYAKNRYDEKLKTAAATYGGVEMPANGLLRLGSKGARVRELQALLGRAGYTVKADGDFGPTTKAALVAFQAARNLVADGIYGPKTETALAELRQDAADAPGKPKLLEINGVRKGVTAAIAAAATPEAVAQAKGGLETAAAQIIGAGVQSVVLDYLATGLTVAASVVGVVGLVVAARAWLKSQQTVEA